MTVNPKTKEYAKMVGEMNEKRFTYQVDIGFAKR